MSLFTSLLEQLVQLYMSLRTHFFAQLSSSRTTVSIHCSCKSQLLLLEHGAWDVCQGILVGDGWLLLLCARNKDENEHGVIGRVVSRIASQQKRQPWSPNQNFRHSWWRPWEFAWKTITGRLRNLPNLEHEWACSASLTPKSSKQQQERIYDLPIMRPIVCPIFLTNSNNNKYHEHC